MVVVAVVIRFMWCSRSACSHLVVDEIDAEDVARLLPWGPYPEFTAVVVLAEVVVGSTSWSQQWWLPWWSS